ncbi:hypothetical protein OF83DRAFT_1085968 [Amylostereum chailletii]|nr:hypothetical protein OF83DRAFT_1085968 [Amylostereum chailletii]
MSSPNNVSQSVSEQSIPPASRTWLPSLSIQLKRRARRIRWSFRFAQEQNSEHHLYEGVNDGLKYPAKHYSIKGRRLFEVSPQGAVNFEETIQRRDLVDVNDPDHPSVSPPPSTAPRPQTRSVAQALQANAHENANDSWPDLDISTGINATNSEDNEPDTSPSAATTNASSDFILLSFHRITDFLISLFDYDSDGSVRCRGIVAVVEVKKFPEPESDSESMVGVAREIVASTFPQLLQQARYALHEYPNQGEIWGIIFVGGWCQYFRFRREELSKLNHTNAGIVEPVTAFGFQGRVHRMIDPTRDRFNGTFMRHFDNMVKWSEALMV